MNFLYRIIFSFIIVAGVFNNLNAQGLLINELMSSNTNVIYDEDGDSPDWIEIINTGSSDISLSDYYLSDNSNELLKWQFPEFSLSPNQPFLVFASGKDRRQLPNFWYTIIDVGDNWKYLLPTTEPSVNWKKAAFDDSSWKTGASGIGYGDNDDNTNIPSGTISVFMRKKFTLSDLESIESLWLNMDYDDGFIAYLNDTEVHREGMGASGSSIRFDQSAYSHEANIYQGGKPDGFDISEFIYLLNENENVLSVQVHNAGTTSSDMTAIPFLTVGYNKQVDLNAPVSEYMNTPSLFPHTNFKLTSAGETINLSHKNGTITDSVTFEIIPSNLSFGRNSSAPEKWGYFEVPTPGMINDSEVLTSVVMGEIEFSISEMFLTTPGYLSLLGALDGEEIRYTDDGTEPTKDSKKYQFGIQLDKSKVIRARIFKAGAIPGKIVSRTYLFEEKPTLPVVSITTNPENLWDNETGIYVLGDSYTNENPFYGANFWEDWEKPASMEMVGINGQRIFSMNCGIKIFGAWSRAHPNKSLAVFFRKEYGDPVLQDVQLFESKRVTEFKSLVLRNSGNDYSYSKFRDGMMTSLVSKMDNDIAAFQPVILYLNGEYWGELNLREKLNEDFLESNYGFNASEIDILEPNGVIEGDNEHYLEMLAFIENNNMSINSNYEAVASKMDISNFIDYQLSEIYFDNRDWPGNNIKYWRPQTEDGKWRWLMYDTDFGFGIYNTQAYQLNTLDFATALNGPGWPNPPWSTFLLRKLLENTSFRNLFVNRFADMLNTTFVAESVIQHIDSIAGLIEPEIQKNYDRWRNPGPSQWQSTVQTMRTFASQRVDYVRNHIKQKFSLPKINELTVSVLPSSGGNVQLNSIKISGTAWKGKYFENVPITLTSNSLVGYKFLNWEVDGVVILDKTIELNLKSATSIRVFFEESEDDGKTIVINEINYNSHPDNIAGDWVEFYNWGKSDIDISGWIFKDDIDEHGFIIPGNTILKSKDYLVLSRTVNDFSMVHPDVLNVLGDFDFGLGSAGDAARLFDGAGNLVDEVLFGSDSPWPNEPNGGGPTLELENYTYNNNDVASWKSSSENLGTPGEKNSISTGIEWFAENSMEKQLKVYPNPFTTETRIQVGNNAWEPMKIQIYTMDGRIVCNENSSNNEFVWRGNNQAGQKLQPGIYICKVQSGANIFTSKIILNR